MAPRDAGAELERESLTVLRTRWIAASAASAREYSSTIVTMAVSLTSATARSFFSQYFMAYSDAAAAMRCMLGGSGSVADSPAARFFS